VIAQHLSLIRSIDFLAECEAMQIRRITNQGPESISDFFTKNVYRQRAEVVAMMHSLLEELESVDHPPVWAFTSISGLALTDVDDWQEALASVDMPRLTHPDDKLRFKVRYVLPFPEYSDFSYADDAAHAAQLVVEGFDRAQQAKLANPRNERWRELGPPKESNA
jgi:hypothetical protein